ncbi:tetratricopeptide repeat protein [Microbacterium sp. ARD31]|uniref:tetratricopeptide repeat protein n=1 Tax=Microbacterium sp. ARD31 TaxID=2962576 RepID=UPI002882BE22|nr:tetratricopeptide repeat protein [Microbacterium sp. ARD31]MDT0179543.1 tetratricopeptide repeat protein [Microbacterium sp. ARD31]
MTESIPLRIFLATPGDLQDERGVVLSAVEEHNRRRRRLSNVHFEVVGWEQVRGTARRPQEAINELIRESHFMIVMFKEKWGSEPGSPWGYTSGTEEELFTGLLELGETEQPMRDVWVTFMAHARPHERTERLREQLVRDHALLFESIPGIRELKERLKARLLSWEDMASSKRSRHVDLISSTGKEVLRAARLRIAGEKLVELGQPAAGRASLEEAAAIGGPAENLAFGQFLARQGDLDGAFESTQIAIDQCLSGASDLYATLTAEALAAQAGILRRKGDHNAAIGRLRSASTLLLDSDPFAASIKARILDEIGLAHQKLDEFDDAAEAFAESLEIRMSGTRSGDVAQSHINLARLEVGRKDLDAAIAHAVTANDLLRNAAPTSLHANAATLLAQIHLRRGDQGEAIIHAKRALAYNEQFANTTGEAIALLLLAQIFRAMGDHDRAAEHARECRRLNLEMGNSRGADRAQWLLEQMSA